MVTPAVQAAMVVLVAFLLRLGLEALGLDVDEKLLLTLATALVAWILGIPAGARTARAMGVKE